MPKFQRARTPEEKEVRRKAILRAARQLAREVGPIDLSLNEVGRRSGVSKPNIYRYFESREEILLHILKDEIDDLALDCEEALAKIDGDVAAVASLVSREYLARPLLCQLLGMAASIIEHNISADAIASAKLGMVAASMRASAALLRSLPFLSIEDAMWATHGIALMVASLWPAANPSSAAAEALRRPELCAMQLDAKKELRRFIEVMLTGLAAQGTQREQAQERSGSRSSSQSKIGR